MARLFWFHRISTFYYRCGDLKQLLSSRCVNVYSQVFYWVARPVVRTLVGCVFMCECVGEPWVFGEKYKWNVRVPHSIDLQNICVKPLGDGDFCKSPAFVWGFEIRAAVAGAAGVWDINDNRFQTRRSVGVFHSTAVRLWWQMWTVVWMDFFFSRQLFAERTLNQSGAPHTAYHSINGKCQWPMLSIEGYWSHSDFNPTSQ